MDPAELGSAAGGVELVRSFVALELPAECRRALGEYVEICRSAHPEFRWVTAANLHVTLRFLGHVPAATLQALAVALASRGATPFSLSIGQPGSFGKRNRTRVVWLALEGGLQELSELAATVERACLEVGLAPEPRPFAPHLTLARARDRVGAPAPQLPPLPELPAWDVERVVIFRSRLGAGGAVYSPLHEIPLRG